jgi:hypothetical protein
VSVQTMFQLIRLRMHNDLISVVKVHPGFEFITSDNPVVIKQKDRHQHLIPLDPDNSLWIPIDSKHLLHLNPWADQLDWRMLGRMEDGPVPGIFTSINNAFQSGQAERFLLGTESGLNAFEGNRFGIFPVAATKG